MAVPPSLWVDRLTNQLLTWRGLWLVIAFLLTAMAWGPASRLTFDQSIESMYAAGNSRL